MNPIKQIITVTLWEYQRFFKPKNELIGIIVMLVIFTIGYFGGNYAASGSSEQPKLAVSENINESLIEELESSFEVELISVDEVDGFIEQISITRKGQLLQMDTEAFILNAWEEPRQLQRLQRVLNNYAQLTNMEKVGVTTNTLEQIYQPANVREVYFHESHRRSRNVLAIAFSILMLLAVFISFAYQFTAITGEKQTKITEQIVSAIKPQLWMDGKILGITLTGLSSILTYSIIGTLAGMLVSQFAGISISMVFQFIYIPSLFPVIFVYLLFTLLGILFWNAFLAAIASLINDPNNSGKTTFMMVPILFVLLAFLVLKDPGNSVAVFLSWFPLTSASAMPVRAAVTSVGWYEIAGSFSLLTAAFYFMRKLASKIFRFSILLTGKEPSWIEVIKAIRS